ncbi:dehydrogenase, partial [Streptomyces sp. NPDC056295]
VRTPQQGAVAAIRLATVEGHEPTGRFFSDEGEIPW